MTEPASIAEIDPLKLPVPMALITPDRRVQGCTPAFAELLGKSPAAFAGQALAVLGLSDSACGEQTARVEPVSWSRS